jgi:hypothetical protein
MSLTPVSPGSRQHTGFWLNLLISELSPDSPLAIIELLMFVIWNRANAAVSFQVSGEFQLS